MTDPIMAHYNISLPVVLECDASAKGIGAVLYHVCPDNSMCPVVYVSHALWSTEAHYRQIEWEALAIVFAVCRHLRHIIVRLNGKL